MAIRRVPFDASPKRRAVGSKVTVRVLVPPVGSTRPSSVVIRGHQGPSEVIRVLVPPVGGEDREDVSRHVEQPGRRALEQVDAGLAVDWPALALLAARLPHARIETDLEYDVLRRQLLAFTFTLAFGHALGGDGLDVGAVDGPRSSWRWSPHLLKRERHEIACSTRVHSPSHVSIRSTRLGLSLIHISEPTRPY